MGEQTLFKIQNGTIKDKFLCKECTYGQVMYGAGGEIDVICNYPVHPIRISFVVAKCNEFLSATSTSKREMESIAWILDPKPGHKAGFLDPTKAKEKGWTE